MKICHFELSSKCYTLTNYWLEIIMDNNQRQNPFELNSLTQRTHTHTRIHWRCVFTLTHIQSALVKLYKWACRYYFIPLTTSNVLRATTVRTISRGKYTRFLLYSHSQKNRLFFRRKNVANEKQSWWVLTFWIFSFS